MATTSCLQVRTVAGLEVLHSPGTGPTVVALPGLGSSGWAWEALAESAPELDLYAVSLRGRGGSHRLRGAPGLTGHAQDVAAVVRELGLRDVVVVGHSMGAFLAPVVAAQLPGVVSRLVLLDGGIRPDLPFFMTAGLTRFTFRRDLRRGAGPFADLNAALERARIGPMVAGRPEVRPLLVRMLERELESGPDGLRARQDVDRCVADAVDTFFGQDAPRALAELSVPATVLLASNRTKDGEKPFVGEAAAAAAVAAQPLLSVTRLPGNHVTVVFAPEVVQAVRG